MGGRYRPRSGNDRNGQPMPSFASAISVLNGLKRKNIIREYAVLGAVASAAYVEPVFTEDLDIIVEVGSDDEYVELFRRVADQADRMEGMHLVLAGVPVQIFPSTLSPLFAEALRDARNARVGRSRTRVVRPDHLIVLYLEAFRAKDRPKLIDLLNVADEPMLAKIVRRFDDQEGTLGSRLEAIRRLRSG